MGKKVNMEAAKSNLVNDLKDATIEQLGALIAELNSTRENLSSLIH